MENVIKCYDFNKDQKRKTETSVYLLPNLLKNQILLIGTSEIPLCINFSKISFQYFFEWFKFRIPLTQIE